MRCLFALLCMVACACAADNFKDCGSVMATVKAVKVDGKDTCDVKKGSTGTIQIDFEMKETVAGNVTVLATSLGGSQLKKDKEACQKGDLKCPLQKGQSYTYNSMVKLPSAFEGDADVTWRFLTKDKDDKKVIVICFQVPCKVT